MVIPWVRAGVVVAAVISAVPAASEDATRIVVNFTMVQSNGSISRSVARTVEISLLGGKQIVDRDRRQEIGRGRRGRGGRGKDQTTEGSFRANFRPVPGRNANGNWSVGPNNTLVRTIAHKNHAETIVVALSGRTSCVATVTFRREQGKSVFIGKGGTMTFTDVQAQNISCSISG
jgi:hypothetical protein